METHKPKPSVQFPSLQPTLRAKAENEIKKQEGACEEITEKIELFQSQVEDINERITIIPVEFIILNYFKRSLMDFPKLLDHFYYNINYYSNYD